VAALILTSMPAALLAGQSGNQRQIELIYDHLDKLAASADCLDETTIQLFNQLLQELGEDPSGRLTSQNYPVCEVGEG